MCIFLHERLGAYGLRVGPIQPSGDVLRPVVRGLTAHQTSEGMAVNWQ